MKRWDVCLQTDLLIKPNTSLVTHHLFSEDLQISRGTLCITKTTGHNTRHKESRKHVWIFSHFAHLPFRWGCRWPWPVPLLLPWCFCWVSSHLHEAYKTQACESRQLAWGRNIETLEGKTEDLTIRKRRKNKRLEGGLRIKSSDTSSRESWQIVEKL